MPDLTPTTSPAAHSGRAGRLYGPCTYGTCGNTPTRPFPCGPRCETCTPAALAGEPEISGQYCAPQRCLCGSCPSWRPYSTYNITADSATTDARAIASGKRRASPGQQRLAQQTVQEQKSRNTPLRKGDSKTAPLTDLPAAPPAPEPWCVEVKDIVILSSRQGADWWIDYRHRYEAIGRIIHIPGTATPQGDHCLVLCDNREHAEWLALHMVEHGGVPRTAVKARRGPERSGTGAEQ